ncbi:MAG: carboxypeptidase-like regulatory domain-containing protein [Terracidiphilus sp.]
MHGTVLDTSNEPIAEVVVTLLRGEKFIEATTTDEAGEFNFRSLPDGKYEIDASAGGFHHARYLVILGHQTGHWNRSIHIKLAVGVDQCEGTIEVAEKSPARQKD